MSYYERTPTPVEPALPPHRGPFQTSFATPEDLKAEDNAANEIARIWSVEVHKFAPFSAIDRFVVADRRFSGLLEIKHRTHAKGSHPTVFLNLRKHLALALGSLHYGVRSVFAVRWTDVLGWIALEDIDPRRLKIGGCSRPVKSQSDIEPVIEVPVKSMHTLIAYGDPKGKP